VPGVRHDLVSARTLPCVAGAPFHDRCCVRGARYFLVQRGFLPLILAAGVVVTLMFELALGHYLPEHQRIGVPVGAALGVVLVWSGAHVQSRVTHRLDRAFFRSACDTRQILIDLAEKTRRASNRDQLAELLRHEINEALHPSSLVIYFRQNGNFLTTAGVAAEIRRLRGDLQLLENMRVRGEPWEITPSPNDASAFSILQPLQPECLVRMLDRGDQLLGLAVLGPRLSYEPYSREDKRLLESVANQAAARLRISR
jgi:phosphoserine phosphatase RsbU/P